MNPTNAPILLPKRTIFATINTISDNNIFGYKKSPTTTEPTTSTVDYATQLSVLMNLGIEVNATDYTQSQTEQLVSLLYKNCDLFATDISQCPGTSLVKHKIDTGQATPIRQQPYRHSPQVRKEID